MDPAGYTMLFRLPDYVCSASENNTVMGSSRNEDILEAVRDGRRECVRNNGMRAFQARDIKLLMVIKGQHDDVNPGDHGTQLSADETGELEREIRGYLGDDVYNALPGPDRDD